MPTAFARVGASIQVIDPFPAPASSNAACGFPALRFPARFTSRLIGPSLSMVLSAQRVSLGHTPPFSTRGDRSRRSAFLSMYILRLRSCGQMGAFVSAPPPLLVVERVANSRDPLLHGRYSVSQLLRSQPPPSRLRSVSRGHRLSDLPCSTDFTMGRGRLLQLLSVSLSPCCPYHPAGVDDRVSQHAVDHVAFARQQRARPPESIF